MIEVALGALDDLLQAATQDVGLILTDTVATSPSRARAGSAGSWRGPATGHALKNQEPREFFVKVRRGKEDRTQLAHVVVAHRLLSLCYFALRDERGCRAFPVRA